MSSFVETCHLVNVNELNTTQNCYNNRMSIILFDLIITIITPTCFNFDIYTEYSIHHFLFIFRSGSVSAVRNRYLNKHLFFVDNQPFILQFLAVYKIYFFWKIFLGFYWYFKRTRLNASLCSWGHTLMKLWETNERQVHPCERYNGSILSFDLLRAVINLRVGVVFQSLHFEWSMSLVLIDVFICLYLRKDRYYWLETWSSSA